MPQHHSTAPRGADVAPRSVFLEGRYGRMFRYLPPFEVDIEETKTLDQKLAEIAELMLEPKDLDASGDEALDEEFDGPIPAGFTYLGQFIDHDITFDPVSSLQRLQDPDGLRDFRTPRLDLDSLYGDGPNNNPFMYDPDVDEGKTTFLIGKNATDEDDLPRNDLPPDARGRPRGRALIGDPRNDENVIVSQLHLLFLKFHNKVVDVVRGLFPELGPDDLFVEAQRVTRWHYQWLVVHDFLRRIVGDEVVDNILVDGKYPAGGGAKGRRREINLLFYGWQREPFMPVEFSVAAYRFGHSMIRSDYRLNTRTTNEIPIFTEDDAKVDLRGFRPLPRGFSIDWSFFVEVGDGSHLQHARKIDTRLASPLATVPGTGSPNALAERNLRRGFALKLPTGQRVAEAMGLEPVVLPEFGRSDFGGLFWRRAPLWYYVLKEAQLGGGERLGPVGGRIVAEVLLGLLKGDRFSYVNADATWVPDLPGAEPGKFTLADLVTFTLGPQPGSAPSQYPEQT
jgi:Animal haem peroxidase